jgi:hypothetical protein
MEAGRSDDDGKQQAQAAAAQRSTKGPPDQLHQAGPRAGHAQADPGDQAASPMSTSMESTDELLARVRAGYLREPASRETDNIVAECELEDPEAWARERAEADPGVEAAIERTDAELGVPTPETLRHMADVMQHAEDGLTLLELEVWSRSLDTKVSLMNDAWRSMKEAGNARQDRKRRENDYSARLAAVMARLDEPPSDGCGHCLGCQRGRRCDRAGCGCCGGCRRGGKCDYD